MYDVDGNGWIDLVEMTRIVRSIYKMMGPNQALVDQFETPEKRAEDIFRKMDVNSDGRVTSMGVTRKFSRGGPPFPGGGQTLARTSFIRLKPIHIKESSDSRGGPEHPPAPPS